MKPLSTPVARPYLLVLLVLVLSGLSPLTAQVAIDSGESGDDSSAPAERNDKRWRFGAKVGASVSTFFGDTIQVSEDEIESNQLVRPSGGLTVSYLLDDHPSSQVWLTSGVMFHSRGIKRNFFERFQNQENLDSTFQHYITNYLGYVQVPVLFQVELGASDAKPFFALGGVTSFNVIDNRTEEIKHANQIAQRDDNGEIDRDPITGEVLVGEVDRSSLERDNDFGFDTKTFEFALYASGGVKIKLHKRLRLNLEVGFDLGITQVYDSGSADKTRNNAVVFLAGVDF